jgi:hypothetical protein
MALLQESTRLEIIGTDVWRMPSRGLCGGAFGSASWGGMTFKEIELDEDGEACDEGNDMLCALYRLCQMRRRSPGSPEAAFIRAFEGSFDGYML